jgi:UTP--glucose-1-phosphate uridylyltransferase
MRQKYLALEERARRFDVGVKYGLLSAQLALALAGDDREEVLGRLVEVLAQRELTTQLAVPQLAAPQLAVPQDEP